MKTLYWPTVLLTFIIILFIGFRVLFWLTFDFKMSFTSFSLEQYFPKVCFDKRLHNYRNSKFHFWVEMMTYNVNKPALLKIQVGSWKTSWYQKWFGRRKHKPNYFKLERTKSVKKILVGRQNSRCRYVFIDGLQLMRLFSRDCNPRRIIKKNKLNEMNKVLLYHI